jgi:hypothetical protein
MAGLVVLLPLAGVTAHFLSKPHKPPADLSQIKEQLTLLRDQQEELAAEMLKLREAQEFQAKLLEPPAGKETD